MSFENGVFVPPDNLENLDFGLHRQQNGMSSRNGGGGRRHNNRESGQPSSSNTGTRSRGGVGSNGNRNRDRYIQKKRETHQGFRDEPSAVDESGQHGAENKMTISSSDRELQQLPSLMALDSGVLSTASHSHPPNPYFNPDAPVFQPRNFTASSDEHSFDAFSASSAAGGSNNGRRNRNDNQNIGRSQKQQRDENNFRRRFQKFDNGRPGYQGGYFDNYVEYDDSGSSENPPRGFNDRDRRDRDKQNRKRDDFNYSNANVRGRYGSGGAATSSPKRGNKINPLISKNLTTTQNSATEIVNDDQSTTKELESTLEKVFESKYEGRVRLKQKPDIRNQRETLSDQLSRNAYDCMICVEKVKRNQSIWSCSKCYNVFHFTCLCKWANSSKDEVGWRCPGCQSYFEEIPADYRCFCGATKNPSGFRSEIPHTCGQMCGRLGAGGEDCNHPCSISCHPGPCPPCESMDLRKCCCGKTSAHVKCSSKSVLTCGSPCQKLLNCGLHRCIEPCHSGECDSCAIVIKLDCYCSRNTKEVVCDAENAGHTHYSCANLCGKLLNCKKHTCEDLCHELLCKPCKSSPEAVLSCPCGQTPIAEACRKSKMPLRKSCMDSIPTCGKICGKLLSCGEPGKNHRCGGECHLSVKCPTCPLQTNVKCRCGSRHFDIPCEKYDASTDVTCEKKCAKKRSCGKHKCNNKCCIDPDHICPAPCDRPLRCGNHKCSFLCHNGHCIPCRVVSFDELSCECGASVIYPPVACGTKPPQCQQPCPRAHECEHPVMHSCHSEPNCPPCTYFTQKWCHGKHELRKNVMCHINQVSCGMPCNKLLPCGRHKCVRTCHPGECFSSNETCKKPCEKLRKDCGHSCGAPCHDADCPPTKCKLLVDVSCSCGRKKESLTCWKREKEFDLLTSYMKNIELKRLRDVDPSTAAEQEAEIDEKSVLDTIIQKTPKTNVLECDKECTRLERNRKMMEALQLEDPDATSTFGTPNYSEFLIGFAKKYPQFVENLHDRLTSLVVKAKRSKRKNETYGFESMNRDKRKVIHEYSDHFGCLSESFDDEPNRNVVCTASKDKSYLPAVSLVDAVFRPSVSSGRKNAFNDVEIIQNSKSQIMGPANGKMWGSKSGTSSLSTSKMVPLSTSSNNPSTFATSVGIQNPGPAALKVDFPPLS